MRDTELYQTLLGLTLPWEVTAVNVTQASADRPLGEIAVTVQWRADVPLRCPHCNAAVPGYDSRPRRWRHFNTIQWKTFITADVRIEARNFWAPLVQIRQHRSLVRAGAD
ncbi:MAG: hypothetical protein ACYC18_13095 [Gammaproteobacteria bacterium]